MTDIQIEPSAPTGVAVEVLGPRVENTVIVVADLGDTDGGFASVVFGFVTGLDGGNAAATGPDIIDGGEA